MILLTTWPANGSGLSPVSSLPWPWGRRALLEPLQPSAVMQLPVGWVLLPEGRSPAGSASESQSGGSGDISRPRPTRIPEGLLAHQIFFCDRFPFWVVWRMIFKMELEEQRASHESGRSSTRSRQRSFWNTLPEACGSGAHVQLDLFAIPSLGQQNPARSVTQLATAEKGACAPKPSAKGRASPLWL